MVVLAGLDTSHAVAGHDEDLPVFAQFRDDDRDFDPIALARYVFDAELGSGWRRNCGGRQVAVEVAVVVDVGEAHHHAAAVVGEAELARSLGEFAIAVVDVKFVRSGVSAGVEVEVAVVVDVDEARSAAPEILIGDAGAHGGVFEFEVAEVAVEAVAAGGAGDVDVRQPVAVVISGADPARRIEEDEFFQVTPRVIPVQAVVDAGVVGLERFE